MAGDPVLLDTSLLVAASVKRHPANLLAEDFLDKLDAVGTPTCVTPQVCREFLVVLTRQPVSGRSFTVAEALDALDEWKSVSTMLDEGEDTVQELLRLVAKHQVRGKPVHDCNLVAVMIKNGVKRLATRNPDDFKRFEPEITIETLAS
jgi:predicted nucleic acid-binding protein